MPRLPQPKCPLPVRTPPLLRAFLGYGSAADSHGLAIGGIGVREWMDAGLVERPRGSGDWLVMAFHQPTLIATVGDDRGAPRLALHPAQSLVLWPPGAGHHYGATQSGWMHSWIHCRGAVMQELVSQARLPLACVLHGVDPGMLERAGLDLHHELQSHAPDPAIVQGVMMILVRQLARSRSPAHSAIPAGLLAVRRHLQTHLHEPASLTDLARRAGLSTAYFCTSFHRHFGAAPIDYLISLRLEHAHWLLRDRNRSIAAIARAVGYADAHYFARVCRDRLGCSPSALREAGLTPQDNGPR